MEGMPCKTRFRDQKGKVSAHEMFSMYGGVSLLHCLRQQQLQGRKRNCIIVTRYVSYVRSHTIRTHTYGRLRCTFVRGVRVKKFPIVHKELERTGPGSPRGYVGDGGEGHDERQGGHNE